MHRAVSFLPRNKKNGGEVFLRESCVLQGIKRMEKGSGNLKKPDSEIISLYATLQEPEFRCFALNS